jgi:hypothetical protein
MSPAQRRYLVLEQGVGAAVFNFVLNGLIAWLMFRTQAEVPLWGQQSIAGDTIGTSLLLPLITCLIVTRLARGHVRSGKVAALGWTRATHPRLGWLPSGTTARAFALGLAGMVALAPVTIVVLTFLHVAHLGLWRFILFKASFAAAAALIVTPLVALWAIAEGEGSGAAAPPGEARDTTAAPGARSRAGARDVRPG